MDVPPRERHRLFETQEYPAGQTDIVCEEDEDCFDDFGRLRAEEAEDEKTLLFGVEDIRQTMDVVPCALLLSTLFSESSVELT